MLQKNNNYKIIIQATIITIIFFFIGNYVIQKVENHYYEIKKEETVTISKSYVNSITKSSQAYNIINDLVEDRIEVACKMSVLDNFNSSRLNLYELSDILKVDRIYYYNSKGKILASNTGEYNGWQGYYEHPVHKFMQSDLNMYIEKDLRNDTSSLKYFKYGYYRLENNDFVQIGIRVDKIEAFLDDFRIQGVIDNIDTLEDIEAIEFINSNYETIATTESKKTNKIIDKELLKISMTENNELGFLYTSNKDQKIYKVYTPVSIDSNIIGVLAISYNFDRTIQLVNLLGKIGLAVLFIIYGLVLYVIVSGHKTNNQLIDLAYYDSLTGLPNIDYFIEIFSEDIKKISNQPMAIFVLRFSSIGKINITYGYKSGSSALKKIVSRLETLKNGWEIQVLKSGGNEFMLYIKNYQDIEELEKCIERISELFSEAIKVNGIDLYLKYKVAAVEIDENNQNIEHLLRESSIIMKNIEFDRKNNHAFFNKDMEIKLNRAEKIENELKNLIENNNKSRKLYLNYQPLISTQSNEIIGFEALARFKSENYGQVSPYEFIEIAEENLLIVPLSNIILEEACKFIKEINTKGHENIKIAVNISGTHLNVDNFTNKIFEIIENTQIDSALLGLEITESMLMNNFNVINDKLEILRGRGISISLDDFGTGYSSFSRFGELNIDCLKIDKYFIDKILMKEAIDLIAGEIISMAHKFNMKVVAEGVEVKEQVEYLLDKNCDILQGYYYSKPLSKEDAIAYLEN